MRVLVISVDHEQTIDNACQDPIVTITYLASKDMWVNASDGPSPSNIDYEQIINEQLNPKFPHTLFHDRTVSNCDEFSNLVA
jgi:hypothetical protein